MKKNKKIFILLGILIAILLIVAVVYKHRDRRTYELNLPQIEELSKIELKKDGMSVGIYKIDEITDIINILSGVKRRTKTESIQDSPTNVDNKIQVDFTFKEDIEYKVGRISTIFLYEKNERYYIEQPYNGIYQISADEYNSIKVYLDNIEQNQTTSNLPTGNSKRNPENVTIEVLKDTITNKTAEILITDNNEEQYGWGVEFRVQQKINGEWKELDYISDDLSWIEIAYELNEKNQVKMKVNFEKYYGTLENGTYRIVKPVYDNRYIDLYSNEFEIK